MKKIKAFLSSLLIITAAFSATACSDSKNDADSSSKITNPMDEEKKQILLNAEKNADISLPDVELSNKTIKWMATWNIDVDESGKKTPAELVLFQELYGGNIEFHKVTFEERYEKLAEAINGGEGIDFFYSGDNDAIPKGAVNSMFIPVDDYIDFESPLWEDVKEANDSIMWDDKHYCAITQVTGDSCAVIYNKKTIQEAGLDDPADLYANGEWTWDTFQELLDNFVDVDNQRYGIDGWWFESALINTIGIPPVSMSDGELINNISHPSMERVQNWIYELYNTNCIAIGVGDYGWEAKPNYIGEGKLLFYPVGLYELYKTPEQWKETYGEDAFFVPMPKDPEADEHYIPVDMEAYSFVNGAQNPEGVAMLLNCKRFCLVNDDARAVADAVFVDDYGWTEEMVEMKDSMQALAAANPTFDISKGVSSDCGELLDTTLRLTARGTPWNETYESINPTVQKYVDDFNNENGN